MCKKYYEKFYKFNCCGKGMVIVIMNETTCVMEEAEYNRIIEAERKYEQRN